MGLIFRTQTHTSQVQIHRSWVQIQPIVKPTNDVLALDICGNGFPQAERMFYSCRNGREILSNGSMWDVHLEGKANIISNG